MPPAFSVHLRPLYTYLFKCTKLLHNSQLNFQKWLILCEIGNVSHPRSTAQNMSLNISFVKMAGVNDEVKLNFTIYI